MSALATCLVLLLITGLSLDGCSATTVGECNNTYFISNGQQCQRQMIKNLLTKPNTNCSYEYEGEKSCLRKHIASCLINLPQFVDTVTSLLLHQVYHCGDVTYQPSPTNDFILNLIKCKSKAFMDTEFCWGFFRDKLNANRSDPSLCREYAIAKECITEKAKANCEICELLSRDTYNPFCPDNTDPAIHTNGCQDLEKPLSCKASSVYKMAVDCERNFLKKFMSNEKADCGTALTTLKTCLDEQLSQTCKDYSNNQRFKDDIERAVLAVLRGPRFFCQAVNLRAIDLDFKVRPLIPCSAKLFPEMEKCAEPVRMGYKALNGTGGEFCSKFREAVKCSSDAQTSFCKFDKDVASIIQNSYTSLCVNGNGDNAGKNDVSGATFSVSSNFALTIVAFVLQLLRYI